MGLKAPHNSKRSVRRLEVQAGDPARRLRARRAELDRNFVQKAFRRFLELLSLPGGVGARSRRCAGC
ncbi:hypothetical protein, partial [Methanopyrus kandleri]